MRKRCQLCGGKLENDRCVLCGLDNSKNDSKYVTSDAHRKDISLTHVHKDNENPFRGKTMTKEQRDTYKKAHKEWSKSKKKENVFNYAGHSGNTFKKRKGANKVSKIVIAVIMVVIFFNLLLSVIGNFHFSGSQFGEVEERNYYEYVQYEIPEEGGNYAAVLSPGMYIGGYNIPEGNYRVEELLSEGTLEISDDANSIYIYQSYYDEEPYLDEFRVYNGAIVEVRNGMKVRLSTENAQPLLSEGYANTNTQEYELNGEYTVGKDLPEGVYDVRVIEGAGELTYQKKIFDSVSDQYIWMYDEDDSATYSNLFLQEGTIVKTEDVTVRLTPSPVIYLEDYNEIYE